MSNTVQFRDIQGFPGYRVGDDGTVWSAWRTKSRGYQRGTVAVLAATWRAMRLKAHGSDSGRVTVTLSRHDGSPQTPVRVHRLVLEAFAGPCPDGLEGCHNDGNPANNALPNLRWDTPKANQADRIRHGTDIRGERVNTARLTPDIVRAIRAEYVPGQNGCRRLAKKYGVSNVAIHNIVLRKSWAHVV